MEGGTARAARHAADRKAPAEDRQAITGERVMAEIIPFASCSDQFKAVPGISFDATNNDWALEHLPTVRVATLTLQNDRRQLERMVQDDPAIWEKLILGINHVTYNFVEICENLVEARRRLEIVLGDPPANAGEAL
jgi:hypothetical protein